MSLWYRLFAHHSAHLLTSCSSLAHDFGGILLITLLMLFGILLITLLMLFGSCYRTAHAFWHRRSSLLMLLGFCSSHMGSIMVPHPARRGCGCGCEPVAAAVVEAAVVVRSGGTRPLDAPEPGIAAARSQARPRGSSRCTAHVCWACGPCRARRVAASPSCGSSLQTGGELRWQVSNMQLAPTKADALLQTPLQSSGF